MGNCAIRRHDNSQYGPNCEQQHIRECKVLKLSDLSMKPDDCESDHEVAREGNLSCNKMDQKSICRFCSISTHNKVCSDFSSLGISSNYSGSKEAIQMEPQISDKENTFTPFAEFLERKLVDKEQFGRIRPNEYEKADITFISRRETDHEKTEADRKLITTALKENFVCSFLNEEEINFLCDAMKFYVFYKLDFVCHQGGIGSHFFIIHKGEFEVLMDGVVVNRMNAGKAFGELALIHNTSRSASVRAATDGALWGVERGTFRNILKQLSSRTFAENRKFLDSVKIFELLTDAQKVMLANALVVEVFAEKQVIVKEGEKGDVLYMIKEGQTEVVIQGVAIRRQGKGDYFGERALLYDEPRSATIIALERTVCVSICRDLLEKVLGNLHHVLFHNVMLIALQNNRVCQQFTEQQLGSIIEASVVKDCPEGHMFVTGDVNGKGVRFLIVLEGQILITLEGRKVCRLSRGQSFGDEYILSPMRPFQHKIISLTKCKLALLTYSAFTSVLGAINIEETFDYNNRTAIIKKMYIFRYLSDEKINSLVRAFKTERYTQHEMIIREGEIGTCFYLIKSGEVTIFQNNKKIRTCGRNDYFGERALLYDEPRTASVEVSSDVVELWTVEKSTFFQYICAPMLHHLEERIRLQDTKVSFGDLIIKKVIGRGTFGTVKLVTHKLTGTRYALKCVRTCTIIQKQQKEHIRLEREILAENDHPFIVKLVRTFCGKQHLYFLMELVTGGDLYDAIRKIGLLNRYQSQFYLASTILAIEYLHERNIGYRDLKPENILLDSQGYIKLIDFGCAKKINGRCYTFVGTPHYMAPEVILGRGYTAAADIWAFGVCLYEFLCGPLPFGNNAEDQLSIFRDILTAKLTFPHYVSDQDAIHLMKRFLCRSPEIRIGCSINGYKDIKQHPFFKGFDWHKLLVRSVCPPLIPQGEIYPENTNLEDTPDKSSSPNDSSLDNSNYDWEKDFDVIDEPSFVKS